MKVRHLHWPSLFFVEQYVQNIKVTSPLHRLDLIWVKSEQFPVNNKLWLNSKVCLRRKKFTVTVMFDDCWFAIAASSDKFGVDTFWLDLICRKFIIMALWFGLVLLVFSWTFGIFENISILLSWISCRSTVSSKNFGILYNREKMTITAMNLPILILRENWKQHSGYK